MIDIVVSNQYVTVQQKDQIETIFQRWNSNTGRMNKPICRPIDEVGVSVISSPYSKALKVV